MCEICLKNPCASGCPNAPDPEPLMTCIYCEEGIYDGDQYFETKEGAICKDCIHDMNGLEAFELLGEILQRAGKEE